MSLFNIGQILQQYSGANSNPPPQQVEQDFDNIAQNAPPERLAQGLSEAFHSDQTPPFGSMVGQLFNQGDTNQRTGMLNHLLGALGPGVASLLAGGLGGGALGGILNRITGQQQPQLTPEEAQQFTPEHVQEIANHAERTNPGIVEQMSHFYAQNPNLVKTLGGAALAIALGKMAQRH